MHKKSKLLPGSTLALVIACTTPLAAQGSTVCVSQEQAPGAGDFVYLGAVEEFDRSTESAAQVYSYGNPANASYNGFPPPSISDTSQLFLVDTNDGAGVSLFVVHDTPNDVGGGTADMAIDVAGDTAAVLVRDDPGETYNDIGGTQFTISHVWAPCCTDGFVIGTLEGDWVVDAQFRSLSGMDAWQATSADGTFIALVPDPLRRVRLASCGFEKELTSGPDRNSVSFDDFADTSGLTLNGSAAQALTVLRLTPAAGGQAGSAFTTNALDLGAGASFSTYFSFQMSNPGGAADPDGLGADGLTFVVQNDGAGAFALGGAGGSIGYSGILNSLTVEYDSWDNGGGLGDPNGNHVGVGINGVVGSEPAVAVGPPRLNDGAIFYTWIDYDGGADVLEVRLNTINVRPAAPTLSQAGVDLETLLGGTTAHVGFTSATGAAFNNHDILSWQFGDNAIDLVVPINVSDPTAYDFTITWAGNDPVWIYDRVPAEWDVTNIEFDATGLPLDCGGATDFVGPYGTVEISRGGKPGKKCNSDTGFRWMPGDDNTLNVQTLARCHDSRNNDFCRPTSCGALYLNYGAIALLKDPDTGEPALDDEGNPIVVDGPTDGICLAAVDDVNGDGTFTWDGTGDEDGDGLADHEEACEVGTDPCVADTDGDGVLDGADECPLEGPPNPELGEILDPDGCIRQSECSDGIDNDDDGPIDYPADISCESLVDDSEDFADCPCWNSSDLENVTAENVIDPSCSSGGDRDAIIQNQFGSTPGLEGGFGADFDFLGFPGCLTRDFPPFELAASPEQTQACIDQIHARCAAIGDPVPAAPASAAPGSDSAEGGFFD